MGIVKILAMAVLALGMGFHMIMPDKDFTNCGKDDK